MQRWVVSPIPQFEHDGWTPQLGILKGTMITSLLAAVLACILCTFAWYLPSLVLDDLIDLPKNAKAWDQLFPWSFTVNAAIGAVVIWLLLEAMYRTSGMAGDLCTTIVFVLAVGVVASKHVLFAVNGVYVLDGFIVGRVWLTPEYLIWYSYGSWVGMLSMFAWRYFTEQ